MNSHLFKCWNDQIKILNFYTTTGAVELFSSPCQQESTRFYHNKGFFGGFVEGWASYAENPVLSDDVMLYENDQMQKMGMYKWQVWFCLDCFYKFYSIRTMSRMEEREL